MGSWEMSRSDDGEPEPNMFSRTQAPSAAAAPSPAALTDTSTPTVEDHMVKGVETVESHLSTVSRKLGAVLVPALRWGWIPLILTLGTLLLLFFLPSACSMAFSLSIGSDDACVCVCVCVCMCDS